VIALVAGALACESLHVVPEAFQVAWVSPVGQRVGRNTPLQMVRVSDLRQTVESAKRDQTAVLRALGLVGKHVPDREWKVTVFDVRSEWLCRPMDGEEGDEVAGVGVCPGDWQRRGKGVRRKAWTGCGYLHDPVAGTRTLDVFRVPWSSAISFGFCVMPMTRFLEGA